MSLSYKPRDISPGDMVVFKHAGDCELMADFTLPRRWLDVDASHVFLVIAVNRQPMTGKQFVMLTDGSVIGWRTSFDMKLLFAEH